MFILFMEKSLSKNFVYGDCLLSILVRKSLKVDDQYLPMQ